MKNIIKNSLMIPVHFTIGYIAIIVCGTISLFDIFINKANK